jgi:hypothetical protein
MSDNPHDYLQFLEEIQAYEAFRELMELNSPSIQLGMVEVIRTISCNMKNKGLYFLRIFTTQL